MGIRGVTLIELMAAVVLVAFVVSGMSLFMPRASKAAITNRYLTTAKNLATGRIQEIKQKSYQFVTPTAATDPPFHISGTAAWTLLTPGTGCDCSKEDPATFPDDINPIFVDNGVTFKRKVCINLVNRASGGAWVSNCPAAAATMPDNSDAGLKNIRVRVTYTFGVNTQGVNTQSVDAESLVSR